MRHANLDSAGITLSGICLVHCLALPLLATLLPAAGTLLDEETNHLIHWTLLGIALPVSILALGRGSRILGSFAWLITGLVGLGLMTAAVIVPHSPVMEERMTLVGVLLLATAHLGNWFDPRRRAVAGH